MSLRRYLNRPSLAALVLLALLLASNPAAGAGPHDSGETPLELDHTLFDRQEPLSLAANQLKRVIDSSDSLGYSGIEVSVHASEIIVY